MDNDTKKVHRFLKSLNDVEFIYTETTMSISKSMKSLVREFELPKERFCELMGISKRRYNDYIKGAVDYSLMDMAKINAAWLSLKMQRLEEKAPIQVAKSKKQ